jgi:hypothetical protein
MLVKLACNHRGITYAFESTGRRPSTGRGLSKYLEHCFSIVNVPKVAFFDHFLKTLLQFGILAMAPRAPIISTGSEIGGESTNWELDVMFAMEFSFQA